MSMKDKDVIKHMLKYNNSIMSDVERFGNTFEDFERDESYRNSCSMCIQQIGELTRHLSAEFKALYNEVPWDEIRAMRNIIAHGYWKMRRDEVWGTMMDDVPKLKAYCEKILGEMG